MGKSYHLYLTLILLLLSFSNSQARDSFQDGTFSHEIESNTSVLFNDANSCSFSSPTSQAGGMMEALSVSLQQFRFSNHYYWKPTFSFKYVHTYIPQQTTGSHAMRGQLLSIWHFKGFYLYLLQQITI